MKMTIRRRPAVLKQLYSARIAKSTVSGLSRRHGDHGDHVATIRRRHGLLKATIAALGQLRNAITVHKVHEQ